MNGGRWNFFNGNLDSSSCVESQRKCVCVCVCVFVCARHRSLFKLSIFVPDSPWFTPTKRPGVHFIKMKPWGWFLKIVYFALAIHAIHCTTFAICLLHFADHLGTFVLESMHRYLRSTLFALLHPQKVTKTLEQLPTFKNLTPGKFYRIIYNWGVCKNKLLGWDSPTLKLYYLSL